MGRRLVLRRRLVLPAVAAGSRAGAAVTPVAAADRPSPAARTVRMDRAGRTAVDTATPGTTRAACSRGIPVHATAGRRSAPRRAVKKSGARAAAAVLRRPAWRLRIRLGIRLLRQLRLLPGLVRQLPLDVRLRRLRHRVVLLRPELVVVQRRVSWCLRWVRRLRLRSGYYGYGLTGGYDPWYSGSGYWGGSRRRRRILAPLGRCQSQAEGQAQQRPGLRGRLLRR